MATCGGCGKTFEVEEDDDFNTLCDKCPVPHQLITRLEPGRDRFRCDYCGEKGTQAELAASDCDCEELYVECERCGGAPYCERDCPGIAETLQRPDLYVIGFEEKS